MKLFDLHEDVGYWYARGLDFERGSAPSTLEKLQALGDVTVVAIVFPAIGRGRYLMSRDALIAELRAIRALESQGKVRIVRSAEDLDRPGVKMVVGLEGADVLYDADDLYWLHDLGLRLVALTWNYNNKFAASCTARKDYGLTDDGEELVKTASELGMAVDVSHASKNAVLDASKVAKKPLVATHSNAYALKQHYRNLDDEALSALASTGGVVGVTSIPDTLPEPTIRGIVRVAEYIGDKFGWAHVALGTDFLGLDRYPEGFSDLAHVKDLYDMLGEHAEDVLWRNAYEVFKKILG